MSAAPRGRAPHPNYRTRQRTPESISVDTRCPPGFRESSGRMGSNGSNEAIRSRQVLASRSGLATTSKTDSWSRCFISSRISGGRSCRDSCSSGRRPRLVALRSSRRLVASASNSVHRSTRTSWLSTFIGRLPQIFRKFAERVREPCDRICCAQVFNQTYGIKAGLDVRLPRENRAGLHHWCRHH